MITLEQPPVPTLGDTLAATNQPFPEGLLTLVELAEIDKKIRGVASVTSGGVILSPWQCLSDKRVLELATTSSGIGRVTSGLSNGDPMLWS